MKQYIKPEILIEEIELENLILQTSLSPYGCGCTVNHNGSKWKIQEGYCTICRHHASCECHNLRFPQLLDYFEEEELY